MQGQAGAASMTAQQLTENRKLKPIGYDTIHKIKDFLIGLWWVITGPGPILPWRKQR
jgi:hypothetical protein